MRVPDRASGRQHDLGLGTRPRDRARSDGTAQRVANIVVDVTERKKAEEYVQLLMREMTHRSKNLLAVVQAIAARTARTAGTLEGIRSALPPAPEGACGVPGSSCCSEAFAARRSPTSRASSSPRSRRTGSATSRADRAGRGSDHRSNAGDRPRAARARYQCDQAWRLVGPQAAPYALELRFTMTTLAPPLNAVAAELHRARRASLFRLPKRKDFCHHLHRET